MTTSFKIADGITPRLNQIAREMRNPRKLLAGLGKDLEIQLRKHFADRDAEGNTRGFPSKHFWMKEVRANTALTEVTSTKAVVTISSPAFVHKVTGGVIKAKRGGNLTIPQTAEADAIGSASLFPRPLHRRGKTLYDQDGVKQYALTPEVDQEADPDAWPDQGGLENALLARAEAMLSRVLKP